VGDCPDCFIKREKIINMENKFAGIVQEEEQSLIQKKDGSAILTSPLQLKFERIDYHTAMDMIVTHHYLHRKAPTSWSFGAFLNGTLEGVCTVGKPASHTLLKGVAGKDKSKYVFELNRLWMSNKCPKYSESRFIGWVLRQLPKGTIVVSYADTKYGHVGTVYQATNWIFTGQSIPFTDYTKNGLDHRSIPKEQRIKSEMDKVVRSRKNRYVYFTDSKDKKLLKWKSLPYRKLINA